MKKRKKRMLVACTVLLVFIGLAVWQKGNLQAGILSVRYSREELEERLKENDEAITEVFSKIPEITLEELPEEDRQKLREGKLTEEDAVAMIMGSSEKEESSSQTEVTVGSAAQSQTDSKAAYARIQELLARVYVMRDIYISKLETIRTSGTNAYYALPKEERTSSAKKEIALDCIEQATVLEGVCDSEMDAILEELTAKLKEVNGDMGVVSDIKAAYAEEKALKKAYYMSLYQG